jgi:curved DNA-binding protein CbpA
VNHYEVLQVARTAEPEVIDKAYRALSLKYHPDVASADRRDAATKRMQRINEAYRVLSDPALRRRYDARLPQEDAGAWDVFLERGLVGMFIDRYGRP